MIEIMRSRILSTTKTVHIVLLKINKNNNKIFAVFLCIARYYCDTPMHV